MSIFSLLSSVLLSLVWPITVLDNQRFIWFALLVFFFYERTSSFISWSLSSRPLASSFALRCCDSVEDLAFFSSEVSCLLFESSRRNERLSTSAEWRRWVKPRMWLWRALTVCCRQERKKEMTHHHTPRHHTHTGSSVHTTLEKFEHAALFLRLVLPSTLSLFRHENGAFRKSSSNRRNSTTPTFGFRVDGNHFENGAFRNRWRHDSQVISLPQFSQKQIQNERWLFRSYIPPAWSVGSASQFPQDCRGCTRNISSMRKLTNSSSLTWLEI